jgi:hypothetical protein
LLESVELEEMVARFDNNIGAVYIIFALLVALTTVCFFMGTILVKILVYILCCCGFWESELQEKEDGAIKVEEMLHAGVDSKSMDIFKDYKLQSLKLFYARCRAERDDVMDMNADDFIDKTEDKAFLEKVLSKRVEYVERAIKSH